MVTRRLYNRYLESKELTTSPTTTGIMSYSRLDPTEGSCSTLHRWPTPWHRRSILVRVSISAQTLALHHGLTSTMSGSIGKTVEVAETRAGAPLSGTTAGESSEADTFSHTTTGQALHDTRACGRSTSSTRSPKTTLH